MKNQTPTNKKKKPITAHRGATAIHESPRREPSVTPRQRDVGIGMGADPNTQQPKLKNPTRAKLQDREKMFDAQQAQHKAMFKKGKQWSDPKARRQFNLSQRQEREMFNLHRTTGGKNPRAMFDLSKRHQRRSFKRFGNPADREKFFTGLKSQTQQFNAAELAKQRMNEQARGPRRGPSVTPRPRATLDQTTIATHERPRRGPSVAPRPRGLPLGFLNPRGGRKGEGLFRSRRDLVKGQPRRGFGGTPMPTRRGPSVTPRQRANIEASQRLQVQKANEQARGNARRNQLIAEGEATRAGNKGMDVTKKAVGHNDFRKGGLTLSIVDNLKK